MTEAQTTREKLLHQAMRLIWARGYSNVSVRDIAGAAGVDVSLISRYFGGKRGLFEATLEHAFAEKHDPAETPEQLVERVVDIFVNAPRGGIMPSPMRMLLVNAGDEDVGEMVRAHFNAKLQSQLEHTVGDTGRAALFIAAVMGMVVAEKTLKLAGIAAPDTEAYRAQLRHMMRAALAFEAP